MPYATSIHTDNTTVIMDAGLFVIIDAGLFIAIRTYYFISGCQRLQKSLENSVIFDAKTKALLNQLHRNGVLNTT